MVVKTIKIASITELSVNLLTNHNDLIIVSGGIMGSAAGCNRRPRRACIATVRDGSKIDIGQKEKSQQLKRNKSHSSTHRV